MIMHGLKYQIGRNTDTNELNTVGTCSKGGLYFTTEKYINNFSDHTYGKTQYKVTIPEDALVYIEGPDKLKADTIIIEPLN